MIEVFHDLGEYIADALSDEVLGFEVARDELAIEVNAASIVRTLTFLRDDANCQFQQVMDICGVDRPDREKRFEVVYNLLSLKHNQRLRIKFSVAEDEVVPSVTGVFNAAGWWEREVWDLFGIPFSGHPDLRRILTDYGFEGHPLRKDFPLSGYVEMRYDDEQKRVVYEPVKLTQEFRRFDFLSPWEGLPETLPGEGKANNGGSDG
jgi:NADH-quinone oxidoreductase subunit C